MPQLNNSQPGGYLTSAYYFAFHWLTDCSWSQSQSHIATVGQSVSKSWCRAPSAAHDLIFIIVLQLRSCFYCGAPSLTRGRVCLLYMMLALPAQSFSRPSPLGLATIFYCLRFDTSFFVASYDSQGHGGGIRPCLHTGVTSAPNLSRL
jgi:hypothetical protein